VGDQGARANCLHQRRPQGSRVQQCSLGVRSRAKVIALHAWQDVGHYPATFRQPNGGAFAVAVNAWLDWHLKGDRAASKMFVGPDCGLCKDTNWNVQMKNVGSNTEQPKENATR
jgi:hypothetical protein